MAPSIPTTEPETLTAGTTAKWTRSWTDFPAADAWAISYKFRGAGSFDVAGVITNGEYLFTVTPTLTQDLDPGTNSWVALATLGSETYEAARGVLVLEANLAAAAIEGRLTADMQAYQIAGRAVTKIPILELYQLRARYQREVAAGKAPGRLATPYKVQFGSA